VNGKSAAFSRRALNLNSAVMSVDDMLDNGQAKAGAAFFAAPCFVDTIETLEYTLKVVLWNTASLVDHPNDNLVSGLFRINYYRGSWVAIFYCVIDQIE
jgi:hypothetical protein